MDRDTPYSCGQFIWTAIDYIGEPTPYQTKNSYFGQMDTAGFPKDSYYVFRSEWTDGKKDPMIHVYPYWDFNPGQQVDVRITSNAPEVELFVNGVSQGKQQIDHQKGTVLQPSWKVPYAPGSICAVAYDETGREIARQERHSFGNTDHYVLKANKSALHADGEDMIFVEISAEDRDGYPVENASDYVRVTVEGAGRLVGLDNGDSADYDAYKGTVRKLFQGKLLAMIAAKTTPGEIRVTVEDAWAATVNSMTNETGTGTATAAAGHRTATVTLQAVEAPIRPGVCATEENREYPPAFVDPGFVPVRKLMYGMAYSREWESYFQYIATRLKEQSSIREFMEGEAHVKGFLLSYMGMNSYYITMPEYEMNKGFSDFYLIPNLPQLPDMPYSYAIEVKYCPRDAKDAEVEKLLEDAGIQLAQYVACPKVQEKKGTTEIIAIALVFRGWDLVKFKQIS